MNAPASFPAAAGYLALRRTLWPERRRVPVLALVIALHVLLILLLLWLAPALPKGKPGAVSMVAVNVAAAPSPQRARPKPQKQQRPRPERSAPQPEAIVKAPDAAPSKWSFGDPALRGFDLKSVPEADSAPSEMADAGPPDSAVVGLAPDGTKLYAAEWQREPTEQELSFYIAKARNHQPGAWGIIACRTAPRFKVEDCRPTSETPGSGMSYAVAEAAWQFRVKPPRVNGEYQVGTWVSIRIDIRPAD